MTDIETFVKDIIKNQKIVIFSKTYCPYCNMAKQAFDKIKETYVAVELDKRDDGDAIQTVLKMLTGVNTVPRVFVNQKCIGGGTDVKILQESGELQKIVAS